MDEIVVAQNKYISSKRASRLTGYAQDYIGQLVRLRKVSATKVGKAWFVDEAGLMRHINGSSRLASGGVKDLAAASIRGARYESTVTAGITYPATWRPITYITDDSPLSPISISDNRDRSVVGHSEELEGRGVLVVRKFKQSVAPIGAVSMDGIRFHTPEVEVVRYDPELSTAHRSSNVSDFISRVIVAGFVSAVLIFFIPIVG